ncbi:MAG: diguanylate cyclase [Gemmatimonadales bacterium]|nr:diguanylate cyclase [Gemmatimonadales bacterium]
MSDAYDDAYRELQQEYLDELPRIFAELRSDIDAFRKGEKVLPALRTGFHRLAGSGGSYGFPEISEIARAAERMVTADPAQTEAGKLEDAVQRLEAVLATARVRFSAGPGTTEPRPRAVLILPPGPEREQLTEALVAVGYTVDLRARKDDPQAVAAGTRPDIIVIGTGPGEGDPSAIASSWTSRRSTRPRAVVLIETLRAVDRLRAVASGVDAVFPADRMVEDLPRYARTLARTGAPPSTVLLLDADAGRAARLGAVLEEANIRVVRSPLAKPVQELLDREVPDLLAVAPRLSDGDGFSVVRMVRQDPRFHLLPTIVIGAPEPADQVEALRAGADDFVLDTAPAELLLQTVITRAERGRRLREMLHRDELTGLLNHGALMSELEYAVEYGRRHGGPLAFVIFDLDRFGEVHERFGQMVGDQVLLHFANVFRSSVRASDVIGRYGGEEFAMILRGASASGAAVLAAKLRRVLGEQPATTAEGVIIPINVSVGWAVHPSDGSTAGELAHAAMRAVRKEKAERR